MPRYVAFFSSMNVGGNRLSMAELRSAVECEDFENVETVIASGNVLFDHETRPTPGLAEKLQYLIRERFGFESMATVRSRDEVAAAISDNPFAGATGVSGLSDGPGEDKFVHTHFLEHQPSEEQFERLVADHTPRGPERIALGDRALYIDYVNGVGTSKLTASFIEGRLGSRGTARNMRSLARILEKMD